MKYDAAQILAAVAAATPEPPVRMRPVVAVIVDQVPTFGFSMPSLSTMLDYAVPDVIEDALSAAGDWVWNDVPEWIARQAEAAYDWLYERFHDVGGMAFYEYTLEKLAEIYNAPDVQIAGVIALAVAVGSGGTLAAPAAVIFGEYCMARGVANITHDALTSGGEVVKEQILKRGYATAGDAWGWGVQAAANAYFWAAGIDPETGGAIELIEVEGSGVPAGTVQVVKLGVLGVVDFDQFKAKKEPARVWPWVAGASVAAAVGYGAWRLYR